MLVLFEPKPMQTNMHPRQQPYREKHTQSSAAGPLLEPRCFKNTAYRDCLRQFSIYSRMHGMFAVLFGGAIYKTYQNVLGDLDILFPGVPESEISLLFTYLKKRALHSEAFECYQHVRLVRFLSALEMNGFNLLTFYAKSNRNVIKMICNGVHLDLIISPRTVAEHASGLDLSVGALYWDICSDVLYSPYPQSLRDFRNNTLDLLFPKQAFKTFSLDYSVLFRIVRAESSSECSISPQLKQRIKDFVAAHDNLFGEESESRANRFYYDLKLLFSLGLAKKNIDILSDYGLLLPLFGYLKTLSPESNALTMHLIDSVLQDDCISLVGLYYAVHWMAIKAEPYALERISSFASPKINFPVGEFNPEADARYRSQLSLLENAYFHRLKVSAIEEHSPMRLSFGDFPWVDVLPAQDKKKKSKKKKEALNELDWFLMGKNSPDDRNKALECFGKAIAMNATHVPSHYECIQIKRQLDLQEREQVLCHYESILSISKAIYQVNYESHYGRYEDFIYSMHCQRGALYLEQRKYKDAERDFVAANAYLLALPDAYNGLGAIAAQQAKDLRPAIAAALLKKEQATEKKLKQHSEAHYEKQCEILNVKFHKAIQFYNRALEISPGDEHAMLALADIHFTQTEMMPSEHRSDKLETPRCNKKKKRKPKKNIEIEDEFDLTEVNPAPMPEPDVQFENGMKNEQSGRYVEAITCYKNAFAIHKQIKSLHQAIDVDLFLGRNKDALEACQLLLNISEQAFQSVYTPRQESPFDDYEYHRFYAFYQRGRVYETSGLATDAIKDFSRIIDAWQSMQDHRYPGLVILTYIRLGYVMHAQARLRRQAILAAELNPTLQASGLETTAMRQTAMDELLFHESEVAKAFACAENLMTCLCPELSYKRHEIYLGLGKIAHEQALAEEAASYYQQCLSVIRLLNPLGVFTGRESVGQILYQCAEYISGAHINHMLRDLVQHRPVSISVLDHEFMMLSLDIYIESAAYSPATFTHAHVRRIEIDIILKKYPEAILHIESMLNADLTKTKSSKRELFCLLGFGYECNGDDEKAKENYLHATVMHYPDDNEAKVPLIKIAEENSKRIKEKMKQKIRLQSDLARQRHDAHDWFLRGETCREDREYQNAADAYCKAVEINPYYLKAQWRQIEMNVQLKRYSAVIYRANVLIDLSKDSYEQLCQSTQIPPLNDYAYHQGYARYQRAHAYVSLNQYQQAAIDYDHIIKMPSETASPMLNILKIQSKKNLDSCHEKMQSPSVVSNNRHLLFASLCRRTHTAMDGLMELDSALTSDIC